MSHPECYKCNIEMTPVESKRNTWQCPLCDVVHRQVPNQQFHMTRIARLDQMVAEEDDEFLRSWLKKHLRTAEADKERCDRLTEQGMVYGDIEEWIEADDPTEDTP